MSYEGDPSMQVQKTDAPVEIIEQNGITYYMVENTVGGTIAWCTEQYEYYVSSKLDKDILWAIAISMGFNPDEFTGKLIEDVYNIARMANTGGAATASWYEGGSIAQAHNGHSNNTWDWVYYDADHYYASEEMKGALLDITQKIGAKYGVTELNLPTDYPDGDVRKGIYSSYNTAINDRMRNDCLIGNILDETMTPPKGMKFFYMDKQGSDPFAAQLPGPKNDPYAALIFTCQKKPDPRSGALYPHLRKTSLFGGS